MARLQIPLPPLAEQKRIAGILDAADALRAKRREALAQLDTRTASRKQGWHMKILEHRVVGEVKREEY